MGVGLKKAHHWLADAFLSCFLLFSHLLSNILTLNMSMKFLSSARRIVCCCFFSPHFPIYFYFLIQELFP
ncbi:Uncharacterized protein APZ42_005271 [Daphnia magna]|uniref:Uncharacterized protein n=1 Tax=Daphnia magna TaxID=35525 RepID=A0A164GJQ7_9CRUS|nr:Uncharacterized protein APZ42_005271 [Daphnia magna]